MHVYVSTCQCAHICRLAILSGCFPELLCHLTYKRSVPAIRVISRYALVMRREVFRRDFPCYYEEWSRKKRSVPWGKKYASRWKSERNWKSGQLAEPCTLLTGHSGAVLGCTLLRDPFTDDRYIFSGSARDEAGHQTEDFGEIAIWDLSKHSREATYTGWMLKKNTNDNVPSIIDLGIFCAVQRPLTNEIVCTSTFKPNNIIKLVHNSLENTETPSFPSSQQNAPLDLLGLKHDSGSSPYKIIHVGRLLGHNAASSYARICKQDSRYLFTSSFDGLVNIYALPMPTDDDLQGPPIDINPISSLDDRDFALNRGMPGERIAQAAVSGLDISYDAARAVSGGNDMYVKVWDVHRSSIFSRMQGCRGWIWNILSGDQEINTCFTASTDGFARTWDIRSGTFVSEFDCNALHPMDILPASGIALKPDGTYFAAACFDSNIYIVDRRMNLCCLVLEHSDRVARLEMNGDILISTDFSGEIKLWKF